MNVRVHPLGTMGAIFHGNPSDICQDMPLKVQNVNLLVVLEEKQGIAKVSRFHPLRTTSVCTKSYLNPFNR